MLTYQSRNSLLAVLLAAIAVLLPTTSVHAGGSRGGSSSHDGGSSHGKPVPNPGKPDLGEEGGGVVLTTLVDAVAADAELTILIGWFVKYPGLLNYVNTLTDCTIFAPTDAAFLSSQFTANYDIDAWTAEQIIEVLLYHVIVDEALYAADLQNGFVYGTALEGASLTCTINANTGSVFLNSISRVVATDIEVANGIVVHKIGGMPLVPKKLVLELQLQTDVVDEDVEVEVEEVVETDVDVVDVDVVATGDVVELASANLATQGYQTLLDMLVLAKLDVALTDALTVTILAPTDEAFAALDAALLTSLACDAGYALHLKEILLYHTFAYDLPSAVLLKKDGIYNTAGLLLTSQNTARDWVQFKLNEATNSLTCNNGVATVIAPDVVLATNGVIHAIDAVLMPPTLADNTCASRITKDASLSTLSGLVQRAGYGTVLAGGDTYTIFAPINEAFVGLDTDSLNVESLKNVLGYHLVAGMHPSTTIVDGLQLTSIAGELLTFSISGGMVYLNGNIPIETTDSLAMNGIVHKIGGVILP